MTLGSKKHERRKEDEEEAVPGARNLALVGRWPVRRAREMIQGVLSNDPTRQLRSTAHFRRLLSRPRPPIDQVVACGVVPRFVHFLSVNHPPLQVGESIQRTSIYLIINCTVLVRIGMVPYQYRLWNKRILTADHRCRLGSTFDTSNFFLDCQYPSRAGSLGAWKSIPE